MGPIQISILPVVFHSYFFGRYLIKIIPKDKDPTFAYGQYSGVSHIFIINGDFFPHVIGPVISTVSCLGSVRLIGEIGIFSGYEPNAALRWVLRYFADKYAENFWDFYLADKDAEKFLSNYSCFCLLSRRSFLNSSATSTSSVSTNGYAVRTHDREG